MASPGNQHCASCIGTLSFPLYRLSHSVCHFPRICQIWRTHKNPTMPQKRRSTFLIDWLYLCTYVDLGESFETNVVDDIPATQKYCAKTLIHVYKTMKNTNYSRFLDNSLYISVPVVSYVPLPTDGHCQKSASIKLTLLQHDSHRKLLCTLVNHSIHRRRCQLVTVPVHIVPRRITGSTANSWAASAPDWPVSRQQHECECVLQGGAVAWKNDRRNENAFRSQNQG